MLRKLAAVAIARREGRYRVFGTPPASSSLQCNPCFPLILRQFRPSLFSRHSGMSSFSILPPRHHTVWVPLMQPRKRACTLPGRKARGITDRIHCTRSGNQPHNTRMMVKLLHLLGHQNLAAEHSPCKQRLLLDA